MIETEQVFLSGSVAMMVNDFKLVVFVALAYVKYPWDRVYLLESRAVIPIISVSKGFTK